MLEELYDSMQPFSPGDLAFVKSLHLTSSDDPSSGKLEMEALFQKRTDFGWPKVENEMFLLKLVFHDVGQFSVNRFSAGLNQIQGFDIQYVGDRGLERINFEILDYEEGKLSFHCNKVEVQHISPAWL